jgi:hypothetical protein
MAGNYIVTKFEDINTIIIPFFNKYPILGLKSKDFNDFVKVAKLIQDKAHLTKEGMEQIKQIKSVAPRMNKGRVINIYPLMQILSNNLNKKILQLSSYPGAKKTYSTVAIKSYNSSLLPLGKPFNE